MCSAEYIQMGREYVIEIDIKDFFDSIDHEYLLSKIKCLLVDSVLYNLLVKYIACSVETDCLIQKKTSGLLQGSSLSPLLSNLYLTELDNWMKMQGYMFVRFADNINIYVSNLQEGYQILEEVIPQLRMHRLEINKEKTGIFSVYSRKYLGYVFEKSGENILVKRYNYQKKKIFSNWQKNSVEHVGNDYYIVNNGILTRKDFTILFANEEQKVYIPAETSDTINIYSNVEIGLNFLETLYDKQLNLNIFNKYGTYIGSFYSANQKNRMKCLMEQVDTYRDTRKRLNYAKKIDAAAIHNLRCNLRYYMKHYPSDTLKNAITELSDGICRINKANSIGDILMTEARCRQNYYGCFNKMIINDSFCFTVRSRRPPKDEINAMISFGNVYPELFMAV